MGVEEQVVCREIISEAGYKRKEWILPSKCTDEYPYWHRLDGPAVEFADGGRGRNSYKNGTKLWCIDFQLHRTDGPAIINSDGSYEWWVRDNKISNDVMEAWLEENKIDLTTEEGQMALILRWA